MKTHPANPVAAVYDGRGRPGTETAIIDRRYSIRALIYDVAASVSEWTVNPPLAHARGYGIVGEPVQLLQANLSPSHG
jgi:hypothetical protein